VRSLQNCLWLGMGYEYARFSSRFDRLLIRNFVLVRLSVVWVTDSGQKAAAQAEPFLLFPCVGMQFCKTSSVFSNTGTLVLCKYRPIFQISYQSWIGFPTNPANSVWCVGWLVCFSASQCSNSTLHAVFLWFCFSK